MDHLQQRQPSLRCTLRVAPDNCPEFQALCDSLQRNDPTVTTIATDRSKTPEGYGRQLGESLMSNNNATVTEIDLNLLFFFSAKDCLCGTRTRAKSLMTWMEQSSSLQSVTLRDDDGTRASTLMLQNKVLSALKKNPNIRAFHSYVSGYTLSFLTEYLSTTHATSMLRSLRIEIPSRTANELNQAAQAIAALSGLKELCLVCTIEFLKSLPAQTTSLLRELEVKFRIQQSAQASDMASLSSILTSSKNLRHITIAFPRLDGETWELVQGGLQSNPSITRLKLIMCPIAPEARPLIVNHMQSSGTASHQNLRYLDLSCNEVGCLSTTRQDYDNMPRLAQMLCDSMLEHVTFDFQRVPERAVAEFFTTLSINSSAVRLRSMHLKSLLLWDMTAYLSSTVHLRHFTFTFLTGRDNDEFAVTPTFLRSLRRNGSLHTVEFKNWCGQLYTPSDDVSRFIQACLTRNGELPDSMTSSFHPAARADEVNERSDTNRDHDAVDATRKDRFPALCRVSQQAERTAPNAMLQGLLASSDKLDTMSRSRLVGKRTGCQGS